MFSRNDKLLEKEDNMAFCKYCGAELKDEYKFCGGCGAQVMNIFNEGSAENAENTENTERSGPTEHTENSWVSEQGSYEAPQGAAPEQTPDETPDETPEAPVQQGKLSVGMLVWSIINTVFSACMCCLPIGIAPLVFAILSGNADFEVSQKNRKRALVLNIIVSALILLWIVSFIVLMILGTLYGDPVDHGASYDLYDVGYYY